MPDLKEKETKQDYDFYVMREREERRIAETCTTQEARIAHLRLADEHAAKAAELVARKGEGAALMPDETDPTNIDQTRTAGPESIRDRGPGRSWDQVDEASDESFPASDPPPLP